MTFMDHKHEHHLWKLNIDQPANEYTQLNMNKTYSILLVIFGGISVIILFLKFYLSLPDKSQLDVTNEKSTNNNQSSPEQNKTQNRTQSFITNADDASTEVNTILSTKEDLISNNMTVFQPKKCWK